MVAATKAGGTRQRRSAEEWRRIFEHRAASGLSIASYCQREGIAQSSYARWRTLLTPAGHDTGVAVAQAGTGFVAAGHLGARGTEDARGRINLTLELGHGIVLHVVRG